MLAAAVDPDANPALAVPNRIERLEPAVVNRIAAGEIIHRPSSALKEMLENCLDAGASTINVLVKQGGIKLLQISDNGHGIRPEDYPILCERFTTSKLKKFNDLQKIATFGFRGEALASISHVAHVTITSMTKGSPCAYRAAYSDGKIVPDKPGGPAEPKRCAGVVGTQISVEDLFFNMPMRRKAIKSGAEEYNRVLDVVTKYAIHFSGVSFSCKKHGEHSADLHTTTTSSVTDNIGVLYGQRISRELLDLTVEFPADSPISHVECSGYVSNANFHIKRGNFIFFINNRLVESSDLKRAVQESYSAVLPKGGHPFVFLRLRLPPQDIDVNVHPTKREVKFLNEQMVFECIQQALERRLENANQSRTFYTQMLLTGVASQAVGAKGSDASQASDSSQPTKKTSTSANGDWICPACSAICFASKQACFKCQAEKPQDLNPLSKSYDNPAVKVRIDSSMPAGALDAFVTRQKKRSRPAENDYSPPTPASATGQAAGSQSAASPPSAVMDAGGLDAFVKADKATPGGAAAGGLATRPNSRKRPAADTGDGGGSGGGAARSNELGADEVALTTLRPRKPLRVVKAPKYASVANLLKAVTAGCHRELHDLIRHHVYVGAVDVGELHLIQHQTSLFMVDTPQLLRQAVYQEVLRRFGTLPKLVLSPPQPIEQLLTTALQRRAAAAAAAGVRGAAAVDADEVAEYMELLLEKAEMLSEYFSFELDRGEPVAVLRSVPQPIEQYVPPLAHLPELMLDMVTKVDFAAEEPCFKAVAEAIADFHGHPTPPPPSPENDGAGGSEEVDGDGDDGCSPVDFVAQHVIFPALKAFLEPTEAMAVSGAVLKIASSDQLYKVFERC